MQRRTFLRGTLAASLGISVSSLSCDPKAVEGNPQRDSLIRQLQAEAKGLEGQGKLRYLENNGFVYEVSVWGESVAVNLGRDGFSAYGNNFRYSAGDTTVRGYTRGKLRIWNKGTEVYQKDHAKAFLKEQERTSLVLQQIREKHLELRKQDSVALSYSQEQR